MSIIAISARIASGKDTVAEIIQDLTATHKTLSDEFGDPIRCRDGYGYETEQVNTWHVKKFAYKLKVVASILTGVPVEKFEDQIFKAQLMGPEWDDGDGSQMTYRLFLQKLGTEAAREHLHTNVWVNGLFSDYKPKTVYLKEAHKGQVQIYPDWIITDCRFPNEYDAVRKYQGHIIRINRGEYIPNDPSLHPSETSLDTFQFDYVIDNNGTLRELEVKVKEMLQHFNYL